MVQETFDCELWLQEMGSRIRQMPLRDALNLISMHAAKRLGIDFWFVEILDQRWTHYAGQVVETQGIVSHIPLNGKYGLVCSQWRDISHDQRDYIIGFIKKIITARK